MMLALKMITKQKIRGKKENERKLDRIEGEGRWGPRVTGMLLRPVESSISPSIRPVAAPAISPWTAGIIDGVVVPHPSLVICLLLFPFMISFIS